MVVINHDHIFIFFRVPLYSVRVWSQSQLTVGEGGVQLSFTPAVNLEWPINLNLKLHRLDCGRKPEYSEKMGKHSNVTLKDHLSKAVTRTTDLLLVRQTTHDSM